MDKERILDYISRGRTDLVFDLLALADWQSLPLSWASEHLRQGSILRLLAFPPHHISEAGARNITSDHGCGWGNGMERKFLGDFLPESANANKE